MLFHVHLDFHTAPELDNGLMLWGLMTSAVVLTFRYQTEVLPPSAYQPNALPLGQTGSLQWVERVFRFYERQAYIRKKRPARKSETAHNIQQPSQNMAAP